MEKISGKITTVAKTGGIKLDGKDKWINTHDNYKSNIIPELKGKMVELTLNDDGLVIGMSTKEDVVPNSNTILLHGNEYLTHEGLLSKVHELGVKSIHSEIVDFSNLEGTILFKATVVMKDGSIFSDFGDANDKNVSSNILPHKIRMASTRAINRALRLATNQGKCSVEELGE